MHKVDIYNEELDKTYELLIGSNQTENDTLLKKSSQKDVWFHLEGISSPHMILRTNDELLGNIPKRIINQIGSLFPLYKKGLGSHYHVIYTEVKNVKMTKIPGTVIPIKVKKLKY